MEGRRATQPPAVAALDEERKALSRAIGERKARGESVADLVARSRALSAQMAELSRPATGRTGEEPHRPTTTDVLTTVPQVVALRDEWNELAGRSPAQSPFLTWPWMASWYETYGDAGHIRCLAVRDGAGHLVGLAPLFLGRHRDAQEGLNRRQIGFASTCGYSWGVYLELVAAPHAQETVAEAAAAYLHAGADDWDCVKLLRVPAESPTTWPLVQALAGHGWRVTVRRNSLRGSVMSLPTDPAAILAALRSAKLRDNIRHAQRRLARDHPRHAFRLCADRSELGERLEEYMALNVARRRHLREPSYFRYPPYRACSAQALQRFWEAGWLRLLLLELEGRPVGFEPFLVYRQRVYLLTPAWSLEEAEHEVGHLLFVQAMATAIAEGAREADFLVGTDTYKARYASLSRSLLNLTAWPSRRHEARSLGRDLWSRALRRLPAP